MVPRLRLGFGVDLGSSSALGHRAPRLGHERDDDIAIVNGAFYLRTTDAGTIEHCRIAFGGMAPVTKLAVRSAKRLATLNSSLEDCSSDGCITLYISAPGSCGSSDYY